MRNRWNYFNPIGDYLGLLMWVMAALLVVPLLAWAILSAMGRPDVSPWSYVAAMAIALVAAAGLKRNRHTPPLDDRRAMILCALGWIVVSAVGAVPFWVGLGTSYLDAYFETVGGFTTTGITVLSGLDVMPRSILFWRSLIQWLGGLGILTFFLAVLYTGGSARRLFGAESHKVFAKSPAPGLFRTLRILWTIYGAFTLAVAVALACAGMGLFDAACHALTTMSTGGYSTHDSSIGYYREAGYAGWLWIEYIILVGMTVGGINFFVHYRALCGSAAALWDSLEMKLWWGLLAGATALVAWDHIRTHPGDWSDAAALHDVIRTSAFQVVSLVTTTGYSTKDIRTPWFGPAAKQILLVLMIVGGCVGSTSGGIKVLRIGVLAKMMWRQVRRLIHGPFAVEAVVVDGETVPAEELRRVAALFFAWMALLLVGGLVTAFLTTHDALASASGMFSALGNIGPCYIANADMAALPSGVKVVYILGMLAGRLEILPLLLLLTPRTWK